MSADKQGFMSGGHTGPPAQRREGPASPGDRRQPRRCWPPSGTSGYVPFSPAPSACDPGTWDFRRAQNCQEPALGVAHRAGDTGWGTLGGGEPFQPCMGSMPALNAGPHDTIHITEIYGRGQRQQNKCGLPPPLSFWTKSISNNQSLDT